MNTAIEQRPAAVVVPADADEVAASISLARDRELVVVVQATGHGAGYPVDERCLLIDTRRLDDVTIDPGAQSARVGAGAQWSEVNGAAFEHGLLGRSGSAPDVGISGYTFGGGAGWLTRPHGLASGFLTAVDYVDGSGTIRRASDDADDEIDREAIFAFRGGGGVGVAIALEFGLVPVEDLWAGFLLWPADQVHEVVDAWANGIRVSGPDVATSIAVLTAPAVPAIPEPLQGTRVVHLAMASCVGEETAEPLRAALTAAGAPAVDTWGRSDVARLGTIHLDPPIAVPGIGVAHWLDDAAPSIARDVLAAAAAGSLNATELRNVDNAAAVLDGAMTRPLGDFVLHAVGGPDDPAGRDAAIADVLAAARPADTGFDVQSWVDAAAEVSAALPVEARDRVLAARRATDPDGVIAPTKIR